MTPPRSGRERVESLRETVGTAYGRVARVGRGLVHPPDRRIVVVEAPSRDGLLRLPGGRFTGLDTIAVQLLRGTYERTTRRLLTQLVRPGATFVDIGANIGYFTVLGGLLTGESGQVLAIEPEPHNLELLRANVRRNGLTHVDIVGGAAAAESGQAYLRVNPAETGWHRLEAGINGADARHVAVPVHRVEDLLAERGLGADVVKIDVEGHEASAVAGLGAVLDGDPDLAVVIEHSPAQAALCGHDPLAALELLWRAGLDHTYVIDDHLGGLRPVEVRDRAALAGMSATSRSENLVLSRHEITLP